MEDLCKPDEGQQHCACENSNHDSKLVVLTGGPGAGKTAVLELVKKSFCKHIQILPEAASILFSGGFARGESEIARRGVQLAIYHVQRQLEQISIEERKSAVVLCDRGSLDGLAYWVGDQKSFFDSLHTSLEKELSRYEAVIHLRSPTAEAGYNHQNPVRTESAEQAARIDEKIAEIWKQHPKYKMIESESEFMNKAVKAVNAIKDYVPTCCKGHRMKKGSNYG